ncbi:MAG: hypothetical protein SH817_10280 [Leptospira sp.]|nr:hypothetical protein [Leptospira sp.]
MEKSSWVHLYILPCLLGGSIEAVTPENDYGISLSWSWGLFVNNLLRLVNGFSVNPAINETCISNVK